MEHSQIPTVVARPPLATPTRLSQKRMLSPSSVSTRRTCRAPSTCSIDSGYGPGNKDANLGLTLDARDASSFPAGQQARRQHFDLGIKRLFELPIGDDITIKQEDCKFQPSTPCLNVCTAFSSPSSPEPLSPASPSEVRRSHARKSASKLPAHAVRRLYAWLDENRHHPYPNAETKQALAETCKITVKQVTTWFTNIRQRQLKSQDGDTEDLGNGNSQVLRQTSRKGKKKDYGRSNGASPTEGFLSPPRLSPSASLSEISSGEGDNWQCTFCRTSLTAKSWRRHEETQHHPKHQWTCLGSGPRIQLPSSSSSICAFCELLNPDDEHFQHYHRIGECLSKTEHERTFGRPDHLHQHAKNYHKCEQPLSELVRDTWRKDGPGMFDNQSWTCGFCQEVLPTWDARATHIAGHFKAGLSMAQWRENRIAQTTLPPAHLNGAEHMELDAHACAGATIAEPSHQYSSHISNIYNNTTQSLAPLPPQTTYLSTSGAVPYFNPFCFYGNPIDTFVPAVPNTTSMFPQGSNMPTTSQQGDLSSMDFDLYDTSEFGNPVDDPTLWPSWQI
ncbi:hypothetical protein E8E13_007353 [Curvularia kusanoi]|uniref:Homeobox domain-containing protein n=1 Tax=Curvularia kusanoi TaxID=90978 RepID=A0A9P4WDS4_CURKU|nr:hypothetical protein E8E13_007353 [Curvularia kusanoi]